MITLNHPLNNEQLLICCRGPDLEGGERAQPDDPSLLDPSLTLSHIASQMNVPLTEHLCSCDSGNKRTVYSLVWSCLVTIFAGTYLVVHPDVPKPADRNSWWRRNLNRLALMLFAAAAPEAMVGMAADDWRNARNIVSRYKARGWTMVHGMFVQMDGFVVYQQPDDQAFQVLHHDDAGDYDIHHIPAEAIWDKSKGDALAKVVVCLQLLWFILQFLARIQQHLAVTELELVTLGYAILALLLCFFWWYKPLDVQQPIALYGLPSHHVSSDAILPPSKASFFLGAITSSIFAAPHVAAWNFISQLPKKDSFGAPLQSPLWWLLGSYAPWHIHSYSLVRSTTVSSLQVVPHYIPLLGSPWQSRCLFYSDIFRQLRWIMYTGYTTYHIYDYKVAGLSTKR
ncbi:hypothetical protein HGRIS_014190 [Hohenbuehelia grisea]|uniref:Uncharacterized protein n=1 Tax=Hohenbuehelia grisea TaxID=104357 RepID=A0ABR3JSR7_9AGAR